MDSDNEFHSAAASREKLPPAKKFEDLVAWKKARILTRRIYEVTCSGRFRQDFGLADQSQRASVSVMANIAEGFDRRGSIEFARFLSYAKGSCSELRSNLFVALDCGYLSEEDFAELRSLSEDVSSLIHKLIVALRKPKTRAQLNLDEP